MGTRIIKETETTNWAHKFTHFQLNENCKADILFKSLKQRNKEKQKANESKSFFRFYCTFFLFFFLSFPHLTMQGLSHIKNSFLAPKRKFTIRYLVDFISVWWECVTDMMRYWAFQPLGWLKPQVDRLGLLVALSIFPNLLQKYDRFMCCELGSTGPQKSLLICSQD